MQGWGGPPGQGGPPPPPGGFGQPPQHPQHPQQGYGQPYPQQPQGYGHPPHPPQGFGYGMTNPYGLACPRCQSGFVHKPSFTWWGGLLGPALLSHAVCNNCSFGFNWKTGKSNTNAIIIYYAVIFGILIVGGIISAAAH